MQIRKHLDKLKLAYKVVDLGSKVFTVKGIKDSGADEKEIVKTLIIRGNDGLVALVLRGEDRVDFKKVRKIFGSKSELARGQEVVEVAKVPVGAVCPILLEAGVVFDKQVMKLTKVHMGSGDLTRGMEMKLEGLLKAVGKYQVKNLT